MRHLYAPLSTVIQSSLSNDLTADCTELATAFIHLYVKIGIRAIINPPINNQIKHKK